jgi:Leucine-rich repeat (LRR) protein
LKNTLSSSPRSFSSWSRSNLNNLCKRTAVSCNSTSRTVLNLPRLNITETLAQFNFTPFTELARFDIQRNNVSGTIPISHWQPLQAQLLGPRFQLFQGQHTFGDISVDRASVSQSLQQQSQQYHPYSPCQSAQGNRDLGANNLENPYWSKFSMPSLEYLSFFLNELTAEFPHFITNCRNLTFLDLSLNKFTGQIPELVFTNLGKLEALNLYNNSFQGPLSSNISKLSNLKNISLNNQLSGQIPESIGSISGLQIVELFSNSFQGNIPSSTGQLNDPS